MDSQRSFFVESGRRATRYIRVIRIGFVKPFDGRDVVVERPLVVNYVTFEPLMLSSGGIFGIPLFESMSQTMKRTIDWLQVVDPGLYSVTVVTNMQQTEQFLPADFQRLFSPPPSTAVYFVQV